MSTYPPGPGEFGPPETHRHTELELKLLTENQRLRDALEHIANWKEFYDRNGADWDEERYGPLSIGTYARSRLAERGE